MTNSDQHLEELSVQIGKQLMERGEVLTTAESCTGGWVSQVVTAIAGSSNWFDCGFVTYSNAAKADMLGVSKKTIVTHGAVSEPVVIAMAQGALQHSRAHWAWPFPVSPARLVEPRKNRWERSASPGPGRLLSRHAKRCTFPETGKRCAALRSRMPCAACFSASPMLA